MGHSKVTPFEASRTPAAARRVVAAFLVFAACFTSGASRADASATDSQSAASPSIAELRARYSGFYRYAGDAREREARVAAIGQSVASFFFAVRGMAHSKLDDRTRIMPTCRFEFSDGKIRSTVPGHPIAISPETGAAAPYRVDDDAILLSQRFEGTHLVQVFKADEGGMRRNEFTLSPDGTVLSMKATLSSPKLSTPVIYTLTYRRVE